MVLLGILIIADEEIKQFVMSCRVVGLDVESAVLWQLTKKMQSGGYQQIIADFIETDANLLCHDGFSALDFCPTTGVRIFTPGAASELPTYIHLID